MEATTYRFNDLKDEAKEKARDWYRNILYNDFYFECQTITDDMKEVIKQSGFELKENGLEWDLGYAQGDYVGISGSIDDKKIHELIMNELDNNKDKKRYKLLVIDTNNIEISHKVVYHHYYGQQVEVDVEYSTDDTFRIMEDFSNKIQEIASKKLNDFVDYLCSDLKTQGYNQIDYYHSDEYIDELLDSNYEFDENGNTI